jgi:hypothetical protein
MTPPAGRPLHSDSRRFRSPLGPLIVCDNLLTTTTLMSRPPGPISVSTTCGFVSREYSLLFSLPGLAALPPAPPCLASPSPTLSWRCGRTAFWRTTAAIRSVHRIRQLLPASSRLLPHLALVLQVSRFVEQSAQMMAIQRCRFSACAIQNTAKCRYSMSGSKETNVTQALSPRAPVPVTLCRYLTTMA